MESIPIAEIIQTLTSILQAHRCTGPGAVFFKEVQNRPCCIHGAIRPQFNPREAASSYGMVGTAQ